MICQILVQVEGRVWKHMGDTCYFFSTGIILSKWEGQYCLSSEQQGNGSLRDVSVKVLHLCGGPSVTWAILLLLVRWIAVFKNSQIGHNIEMVSETCTEMSSTNLRTKAATQIQLAWRNVCLRSSLNNKHCAAIKIQSHVRGWFLRRDYLNQKQAALTIQSNFQRLRCWRLKRAEVTVKSAIIIQCYARRWICQRWYSRCHQLIVQIQV